MSDDFDNDDAKKTSEDAWVTRSAAAFRASTSYVDNNYRQQWERNIANFNSKHPSGSKYHSDTYKFKSRLYRPKTRSMVRQNEAAAAAAFFTNSDAVNIEAMNKRDKHQRAAAELRDGLLNHRLQFTIPWYLICVGGMQDAQVQGVVASKQYWNIKTRKIKAEDEGGNEVEAKEIIKDEPCVDLWPIERVRISPSAKWTDPINTSPYVILMSTMHIYEVKEKIESGEWLEVPDGAWAGALVSNLDTTKAARDQGKEDASTIQNEDPISDYDEIWIHENFMRVNGEEKTFYTLGTTHRLTEAKDLKDVYWHDMRPVAMGCAVIETHNVLPAGTVQLGESLQQETNELANSRIDNIKLVLNKRYIVRRGKQVDLKSLLRNAAGSITLATDPEQDIKQMEFNDVTGSSYAEQDRINLDYDELLGNFSGSSVQSNRKMNETVGGMSMIRQGANAMTQYLISVFAETWVEKVIKQLDALEVEYETDKELLSMIAQDRDILNKYGITEVTPGLLKAKCKVVTNMTNSATDPMIRLEQFLTAIQKYIELAEKAPPDMDMNEVKKEIFGRLGYKDGSRFFIDQDSDIPAVVQKMQQTIQQLTSEIQDQTVKAQAEQQGKIAIAQLQEQTKKELAQLSESAEDARLRLKIQAEYQQMIGKANIESRDKANQAKLSSDTELAKAQLADKAKVMDIAAKKEISVRQGMNKMNMMKGQPGSKKVAPEKEKDEEEKPVVINLAIDNPRPKSKRTINLTKTDGGYTAVVDEEMDEEAEKDIKNNIRVDVNKYGKDYVAKVSDEEQTEKTDSLSEEKNEGNED